MAIDEVTRPRADGTSALLCGKPGCTAVAQTLFEFWWEDWSGLIGSCWEHHEDLAVKALRNKVVDEPAGDEGVPRD